MEKTPISSEVMEALWRVVDAARLSIYPEGEMTQDSAYEFLADQEKMLRRAVCAFYGPDGEADLRQGLTQHPYVVKVHEQERESIRKLAEEEEKAVGAKTEPETEQDWKNLLEINTRASEKWRVLDSQPLNNPHLPYPPPASGCRYHYCWMPKAEGEIFCGGHGGKDCPLPEKVL